MQSSFVLCLGRSAFLIVDSTFHGQWHAFGVRRQPPCSGKFAWLGTILVLPIVRVRLLRLQKQDAITVLPSRACYLAHLGPDLYSKCSCARTINNFGTGSYQMPSSKLVLNGDCVVQRCEVAKL